MLVTLHDMSKVLRILCEFFLTVTQIKFWVTCTAVRNFFLLFITHGWDFCWTRVYLKLLNNTSRAIKIWMRWLDSHASHCHGNWDTTPSPFMHITVDRITRTVHKNADYLLWTVWSINNIWTFSCSLQNIGAEIKLIQAQSADFEL